MTTDKFTRREWAIIIIGSIVIGILVYFAWFKPDTTEIENKLKENKTNQTANEAAQATLDTSATHIEAKAKKAAKRRVSDAVQVRKESNEFKPSGSDSAGALILYRYGK